MIQYEFKKNYLAMIENAAKGENWLFRNFYIIQDGAEKDVLENGGLSCAIFVSSVLYLHNQLLKLLKKEPWLEFTHARVASTEKDMLAHGWYEIKEFKIGAVLIWEKQENEHIGFCISDKEAISNSSKSTGFPWRHDITYNGKRQIQKILWHPDLDKG